MTKRLREGFTTGTAAAAAAAAAARLLSFGAAVTRIEIPLPPFDEPGSASGAPARLEVPVAATRNDPQQSLAFALVIKDGGDDPDVTHGARILAVVGREPFAGPRRTEADERDLEEWLRRAPTVSDADRELADAWTGCLPDLAAAGRLFQSPLALEGDPAPLLYAGPGIGRITLPGLPTAVGEPAINPQPRRQIAAALRENAPPGTPLHVFLAVARGRALAERTLNPRLGIVDGISILGTSGIVRPFSHEAWKATIGQGLAVARALGLETVLLSTGRRSERLLFGQFANLPPACGVQAADFAAFSVRGAVAAGFSRLVWGCFPGKLLKLAQGLEWTHARERAADLPLLLELCACHGAGAVLLRQLEAVPTAAGILERLEAAAPDAHQAVIRELARRALGHLERWAREGRTSGRAFSRTFGRAVVGPGLGLRVFSLSGKLLLALDSQVF